VVDEKGFQFVGDYEAAVLFVRVSGTLVDKYLVLTFLFHLEVPLSVVGEWLVQLLEDLLARFVFLL